ncbi:MAG: chromosome segregation protein SMC [candidate division NC10 bacterium RIFCSPLOWO2_12_FULL_66_18]|nr:MAG: chromosome segregation protein SMC [candidate division NC10 bacterium RIFCSPLOWO2_12_FULL_66_18]
MHLAKISLFGFKSFADKVELSFEPGITVVVGPNGCGKSNISDAVRWALGEQSAKLLRGDRMEDCIFAGNSRRKPLGLAEVSLTLTRNEGELGTDYEEVNVTRRLYRSGESEYLLNKIPCRLRDIHDLFIDTGLAGEPYALIEQGSIGSVVNARPADRRVLIEEAAGIMKYKTKKRAALNKLEATEQNLLRIRDVIAEVERQRNSLKRQANKAERYRELDRRATELKLYLKFREHAALWDELQTLLAQLGPRQETLTGLRAGIAATEADLETRRLQALEQEQAVATAQEALYALRGQIDRDEAELRSLTQQIEAARQRQEENEATLAGLGERMRGLLVELEAGASRATLQEQEVAALEAALAEEGLRLREAEAAVESGVAELEHLRGQAAHQATQLALKRNELATLVERSRQMTAQAERLRMNRAEATTQREGAEASFSADEARRLEVLEQRRGFQAQRETAQAEAERAREARRRLEAEIAALTADVERQRGRLASLHELKWQFADFAEGNRLLLQAGRDRRLAGILGSLAEILEVAPRHEKALEAILGAHLQGVRVRTWSEAKDALAHLFRSGQGRATLVSPMPTGEGTWGQQIREDLAAQLADLPKELRGQIEGMALDLLQTPQGSEPWVVNLLADAVVVSDLDAAQAIARELPGPFTVVTLAGEVLTHRGTLTGGTPAPQGLLAQRREARELEEALATSELGLAGLREALSIVSEDVTTAERAVEAAGAAERQAELDLLAIEKDLAAKRAEEARLSQQLELFGIELQAVEADLGRIAGEVDGLRASVAQGEAEAEALSQAIAARESAVAALRQTREGLAAHLAEQRVTLASRAAQRDELLRDLARMRHDLEIAEAETARLTQESGDLAARQAGLEEARNRLRDALMSLHLDEEARQGVLVQLQEARAAAQEAIRQLEETLRAKRREEAELAEEIASLGTRRGELKTAMTHLEQSLWQDHNVSLPELRERFAESTWEVEAAQAELEELRAKLLELGPANLGALEEYQALCQRHEFLTSQATDLTNSVASLRQAIAEINRTIRTLFDSTLTTVNRHFDHYWRRLIGGGSAELRLVEPGEGEEAEEPGVEMLLRIPGKRATILSLLSGGERALAALALLLALFTTRPSPFCVLDEVDAPLDDVNVERFVTLLREMSQASQFIVISHNKRTMEAANILYGITMEEEGASKVISVRMKAAA